MVHGTGGPAPGFQSLIVKTDRQVRYGPLAEETRCGELTESRFRALRESLSRNDELLDSISVVAYLDKIADAESITLLVAEPTNPTSARQVTIPMDLVPARLLPLLRTLDEIGSTMCGARYEPVAPLASGAP